MIKKRTWFQRPLSACCLLVSVTIISLYIIFNAETRGAEDRDALYSVTLRHYGTDVKEMEMTAAIPLEDALSGIPGIDRIVTISENGRARAFVTFHRRRRGIFPQENDYYDAVRDAAQRVYETLPSSAQRPEFGSSGDFHIPFLTAAVYVPPGTNAEKAGSREAAPGSEEAPDGQLLEKIIKPALSGIEGVGEIEIAGSGITEIIIIPDQDKLAALGVNPAALADLLASNDSSFYGGSFQYDNLEIPLQADGRYKNKEDLEEALIPAALVDGRFTGAVRLKDIAEVREQERESDTLTRLNGKKTVIISISAASGTDPGFLSRKVRQTMEGFSSLPLEFHILDDRGAEEAIAFRSVLVAALEASVLLALVSILLGWGSSAGLRNGLVSAAAIPLISIVSAALLCALGFNINRKFMAGLAIGIGGAVDAVILGAEGFKGARDPSEGKMILMHICPPLISGAATTAAALFPLLGIAEAADIHVIAGALGTVTVVSAILTITLLPPLFLWNQHFQGGEKNVFCKNKLSKLLCYKTFAVIRLRIERFFSSVVCYAECRPYVFPLISLIITAAAVTALAVSGADTSGEWAEDSVYVQIEFESGYLKEEGDSLLASWALDLKKNPAVRDVQTGARTGSSYALVTFDPLKAEVTGIRNFIRSKTIPGAFIFISSSSPRDRLWNITVSGDDIDKCREIVRQAASACSMDFNLSFIKETVLNFKEGGPHLTLIPRRELLSQSGIPLSLAADIVKRGVYGPVVYKRNNDGIETDVRITFASRESKELMLNSDDIMRIPVNSGSLQKNVNIGSLMTETKKNDFSVIRRENRRRTASFSIQTGPGDPRYFRGIIMNVINKLELPPGYTIEFDPEAIRQAIGLTGKIINFVWAVLFCYMVISAAEESFIFPLFILLTIPPSLAIPLLFLIISGSPVNASAACALIAVSGMTVNASVISAGELWHRIPCETRSIYEIIKNRIPALIATTGTTIAGTFPFLFLREGNNGLIRILALVTVLGVGTSFFCSITLIPSFMKIFCRKRFGLKLENKVPHCGN